MKIELLNKTHNNLCLQKMLLLTSDGMFNNLEIIKFEKIPNLVNAYKCVILHYDEDKGFDYLCGLLSILKRRFTVTDFYKNQGRMWVWEILVDELDYKVITDFGDL